MSLIDSASYRIFAGIKPDDESFDEARLKIIVDGVSDMIEKYCNRRFIAPAAAIDEIFNGDGEGDYVVKEGRVATSSTPVLYSWSGTAWTAASGTYTTDKEVGRVYFTDGNVFTQGTRNWKVNYIYGYTAAELPNDIKLACFALVQRALLLAGGKEGYKTEAFGDQSTTYNLDSAIPDHVANLLKPYRVFRVN